MPSITEGNLTFDFPDNWQATKFDEWSFYRNQFQKVRDKERCDKDCGPKAIDILAISPDDCVWVIEIKDYRDNRAERDLPSKLPGTVVRKVRDSLALLVAAQLNANNDDEKALSKKALRCNRIRVVLHLEQDKSGSIVIDPADVHQRLKQMIKAIDPHALVLSIKHPGNVDWHVTSQRKK